MKNLEMDRRKMTFTTIYTNNLNRISWISMIIHVLHLLPLEVWLIKVISVLHPLQWCLLYYRKVTSQIANRRHVSKKRIRSTCLDIFLHLFWLILWKHKTLPHNHSSTMVVCLHSSMVQISKKFNMLSDKLVIFPTKFLQPRKKLIFPYRICKFSYWNKRPSYS